MNDLPQLPGHLAHRVQTAVTLLLDSTKTVPGAASTIYALVASASTGAPEPDLPSDAAFLCGELQGLAYGLDIPVPLLLLAAGVDPAIAADQESMDNALAMTRTTG